MNKIKIIKWFKANFIRFKIHKIIGFLSDYLIYIGYLSKMSKWIDKNKIFLKTDDFYNRKVIHKNRVQLYQDLIETEDLTIKDINYIEFGVGRGNSMRWWTENNKNQNSLFWGFDTFEGLPEKYGTYKIGTFSLKENFPKIDDTRINYFKGLFQDTLLDVIHRIDFNKKNIIHLDADLYSSTLFTLTIIFRYLKKDDIIIFDEFCVPLHEYKAFDDFSKSFYPKLKPIRAVNNYLQVVFKIK